MALDRYVDRAVRSFDCALDRAGAGPDQTIVIAGHAARVRCAGDALSRRVVPALAHLVRENATGLALTVHLWDERSTGVALEPPPWDDLDFHERGNVRAWRDDRFALRYDRRTDVFSALDDRRGIAVYWTRDADLLPNFTSAAPIHRLLQAWLGHRGLFVLHGAAVGRPDGAVLLAARSGSGKSTTALIGLEPGFRFLGDDFALVGETPEPSVHALFATTKLNADALARHPELGPYVANADRLDREKAMVFLWPELRAQIAADLPLRAIAVPRITGRPETVVSPMPAVAAFRAIGPDSVLTMLNDARGALDLLKRLVAARPCFDLALGTAPEGVRQSLHDIIDRAR